MNVAELARDPQVDRAPDVGEGGKILILPPAFDANATVGTITKSANDVLALAAVMKPEKIIVNDTAVDYGEKRAALIRERKRLDAQRLDLTKGLRETVDKINALAAGPIAQLDRLIGAYDAELVDWTNRENSRLAMERQLREQEAEAERQRLRREAEAAQAQADQIRKDAEAEAARLRAIEEKRIADEKKAALAKANRIKDEAAREAARIAAEQAAAAKQREADEVDAQMRADAELRAQSTEAYAEDTARIAETVEAKEVYAEPRAKGMSVPETWFVVIDDVSKIPEMFKLVDEKALNKLAVAQKERFNVPGCHAEKKMHVRSRI